MGVKGRLSLCGSGLLLRVAGNLRTVQTEAAHWGYKSREHAFWRGTNRGATRWANSNEGSPDCNELECPIRPTELNQSVDNSAVRMSCRESTSIRQEEDQPPCFPLAPCKDALRETVNWLVAVMRASIQFLNESIIRRFCLILKGISLLVRKFVKQNWSVRNSFHYLHIFDSLYRLSNSLKIIELLLLLLQS